VNIPITVSRAANLARAKNIKHILANIKEEFPGFKIIKKRDSILMRTLNVFLRVITLNLQQKFLTSYITTINTTIYVGDDWELMGDISKIIVLRHERVHMRQAKQYGMFLFAFLYLIPFFPLFFAHWRKKFEMEAYEETMLASIELRGKNSIKTNEYKDFIIRQFTTAAYGWMWVIKSQVERWYNKTVERLTG